MSVFACYACFISIWLVLSHSMCIVHIFMGKVPIRGASLFSPFPSIPFSSALYRSVRSGRSTFIHNFQTGIESALRHSRNAFPVFRFLLAFSMAPYWVIRSAPVKLHTSSGKGSKQLKNLYYSPRGILLSRLCRLRSKYFWWLWLTLQRSKRIFHWTLG